MTDIEQMRLVISSIEDQAFYPPVAIDTVMMPDDPMYVCANGHRWIGINPEEGCGQCQRAHAFRLKGRTECEEPGCNILVTCKDALWEQGVRKCELHWTEEGEFTVGPVSSDDTLAVLGQYNPRDRWNGWLVPPMLDAWSVVTFLDDLNDRMHDEGPADLFVYDWEERDGEWVLVFTDPYAQETSDAEEFVPTETCYPDEDGLYSFGSGWVWSEDEEYGVTDEWREWSKAQTRIHVDASNESNRRLVAEGVQDRFRLNDAAGREAVAAWLGDNPEPPKYPNGATHWVDLTGQEVSE